MTISSDLEERFTGKGMSWGEHWRASSVSKWEHRKYGTVRRIIHICILHHTAHTSCISFKLIVKLKNVFKREIEHFQWETLVLFLLLLVVFNSLNQLNTDKVQLMPKVTDVKGRNFIWHKEICGTANSRYWNNEMLGPIFFARYIHENDFKHAWVRYREM